MIPSSYIDLDFEAADLGIVQRGIHENIPISWDPGRRCYIAISSSVKEVYYRLDLLCDSSGYCSCPSFIEVQSKKNRPCKHIIALDMHIAKKAKTGEVKS